MSQPPYGPPSPDQPEYPPTTPFGQPASGPPASGPPAFGPPVTGPPAYGPPVTGQPAYGQPAYGPPGYGPPAYGPPPGYPMAPPPKKSKVLPIVLISVAAFLVLCIGGIAALYLIGKDAIEESDRQIAASQAAPAAPESAAPEATEAAPTIRIVEPKTLGGRPRLTDSQFAGITEQLESGLATGYAGSESFGGLYGEVEKQNIVIAIAVASDIPDPEAALAGTFAGIGVGGLKVNDLTPASTGELGGVAECGTGETSGIDVAVCSWADEGSIGMFMWYFKTAAKVKSEFPKLRAQIEKKS